MRLILHNPHVLNYMFGKSVFHYLMRDKNPVKKYGFLIDYLIKNKIKFGIIFDKKTSSFPIIGGLIPRKLEIYMWLKINKIPIKMVDIIDNEKMIHKEDVIFSFLHLFLLPGGDFLSKIKKNPCLKIFHATHFYGKTNYISEKIKGFENYIILAESNLSKNSDFFKKYFNFYKKDTYVLPFTFGKRYVRYNEDFESRKNKCLATGSVHFSMKEFADENYNKEFLEYFGDISLHPVRKLIYESREKINNFIDCYISPRFEKGIKQAKSKSLFYKIYAYIWNGLIGYKQTKYYSFDIVKKFNEYKMFIVGEEVIGLPAISTFEGMACGSACIAKEDNMYKDLGFKTGIHYIGHNGSLEDITKKIQFYQKNINNVGKIANEGHNFVIKNFNEENIAKIFIDDLDKMIKEKNKDGENKIICSFIK